MSDAMIRPAAPMCLVLLTYVRPIEEVDAQMAAHVAFLSDAFEQGVLVIAGRRVPRTGGVLLFRGEPDAVEAVAATDPFVTSGVATFEVVAFTASMAAAGMAGVFA
ncbi:YciI family protein [Sphingomonas qomolangmaensis]|uniref:YciI family protein n=1 Tax=Sphingomonas qomolangmaensis TaxID=2918765 RepID=A0ABY5L9E3_9SPHN|nr:YciI family protein [Sphingomonas qomolangmaensis]UUL81346.1 YciI family protein [Sphingomonas qomolangmaensis]